MLRLEFKKIKSLVLLIAMLLIFLPTLIAAFSIQSDVSGASNSSVALNNAKKPELKASEYGLFTEYLEEHKNDFYRLKEEAREKYFYYKLYTSKFENLSLLEASKELAEKQKDDKLVNRIERRVSEIKRFYHSEAEEFKKLIVDKFWIYLILFSPFIFAGIYSEDKVNCAKIIASSKCASTRLVRSKIIMCWALATFVYWVPIIFVLLKFLISNGVSNLANIPFSLIAPFSSLEGYTVLSGVLYLLLTGYIQFISLSLIFLLISQSSKNTMTSVLISITYTFSAFFGPFILLQIFPDSTFISRLINVISKTPAGFLSNKLEHDIIFATHKFLGIIEMNLFNIQNLYSILLSVLIIYIIRMNSRKCFRT